MNSATKDIIRILEKITATGIGQSQIFDDFLNIAYDSLERLPEHVKSVQLTGQMADDLPEVAERWSRLRGRYKDRRYFDLFSEALAALVASADDGWEDVLGEVYMEFRISNKHTGQFFTPFNIAKMMAAITMMDIADMVNKRIKDACDGNPFAEAILMTSVLIDNPEQASKWFFGKLLPVVAADVKPVTVNDCACGSGVMFLAAASEIPRWMLDWNFVRFYGTDIDQTCVLMAQVNMMLHGLNGYSIKCALAMHGAEMETVTEPYQSAYLEAQQEPERLIEITDQVRAWKQESLFRS